MQHDHEAQQRRLAEAHGRSRVTVAESPRASAREVADDLLAAARAAAACEVGSYGRAAERAHAAARALRDTDRDAAAAARLGAALVELGEARRRAGDVRGAMEALDEAVELGRSSADSGGGEAGWLGMAYHRTGVVFDTIGDPTAAVTALRNAIEAFDRSGDDDGVARVRNSLGVVYSRAGSFPEALEHFGASLRHAERAGDRAREAAVSTNMAITTRLLGQHEAAITFAERALAIKREVEPDDAAGATTNLALALAAAGRHDAAANAFAAADVAHERRGDPHDFGEHLRSHAEFLVERGSPERVPDLLARALAAAHQAGSTALEAAVRRDLASYWKSCGEHRLALEQFEAFHDLELRAERALRERAHEEQRWQTEVALARSEAAAAQRERHALAEQFERLVSDHRDLSSRTADLEIAASSDPLTGVGNRRAYHARLAVEVARAAETTRACSVILLDIDAFKEVNDRYGHITGDEVLRGVADALRAAVRASDTVARIGGDEFAVLLPATTCTDAIGVARTIRARIATVGGLSAAADVHVTVSLGVASSDEAAHDASRLLALTDTRLYEAKAAGRDRVVPDGPSRLER